ncbi:MAG: GAP family protein [Caldilineaceae bacterium]|nr:GAP family protein [Caldilineaceae bacterium]
MINEIAVIVSLAFAASFLPLQLGAQIAMLRSRRGFAKAVAFVSGIGAWRFFLALLWIFFAANGARNARRGFSDVFAGISATFLREFKPNPVWEFALEVLLTMAGVALILYAVRQIARIPGDDDRVAEEIAAREIETGGESRFDKMRITNAFLLGFFWIAVSVNSYILTFAAYQQITLLPANVVPKLIMLLIFLLVSSTLLLIPLLIYMLSPRRAQQSLDRFYTFFQSIGRWLGTVLAALIGLYLAWQGLSGLLFR